MYKYYVHSNARPITYRNVTCANNSTKDVDKIAVWAKKMPTSGGSILSFIIIYVQHCTMHNLKNIRRSREKSSYVGVTFLYYFTT